MAPRCRKVIIGICLFRVNVLLYDSAVADRKDYPFRVLARVSDVHGPFAGFHDLEDRGALVDVFRKRVGGIERIPGAADGFFFLKSTVRQDLGGAGSASPGVGEGDRIALIPFGFFSRQPPGQRSAWLRLPPDKASDENALYHKRQKEDRPSPTPLAGFFAARIALHTQSLLSVFLKYACWICCQRRHCRSWRGAAGMRADRLVSGWKFAWFDLLFLSG